MWLEPGSEQPAAVELEIEPDTAHPDGDGAGGSILRVREVPLQPRTETRPSWLPAVPQARALARL